MTKEKIDTNHHMGKRTGYELINGEYHIAPTYWQQFDFLAFREAGIKKILEIITDHFADDLKNIKEAEHKIFIELADDLGIELADGWTYSNGVLKRAESKASK